MNIIEQALIAKFFFQEVTYVKLRFCVIIPKSIFFFEAQAVKALDQTITIKYPI